jgi:hypothetical protein
LASFLSKKSREGISGLFQQYRSDSATEFVAAAAGLAPIADAGKAWRRSTGGCVCKNVGT